MEALYSVGRPHTVQILNFLPDDRCAVKNVRNTVSGIYNDDPKIDTE